MANAQQNIKKSDIGYYVVVTDNNKAKVVKTIDPKVVDDMFELRTNIKITTEKILLSEPMFEYRTLNNQFYCEKRQIKITKKGKVKYKKLKKKY